MQKKLERLQSSSDIRGIAVQFEDREVTLNRETAALLAQGYISHISKRLGKNPEDMRVSLGVDSRVTGEKLKCAFAEVLMDAGMEVYDFGLATTPSMFMSTVFENYKCDSAVMFTASHLPFYYNGIKFFTDKGGFENEDIKEITEKAIELSEKQTKKHIQKGKINRTSILKDYSEFLVNKIREGVNSSKNYEKPLEGMRIIVDAGNGSGGFFAKEVLEVLGADTTGSAFLNPDGNFPNHIPNPEDQTAINFLKKSVTENNADLGIIFDTDVDRAACVDKAGNEINRNRLIALTSAIVLDEFPGSTIVTDSVTSDELHEFIIKSGGKHFRYQRGYKNVINKALELNSQGIQCHLAIETSGHAAFKENKFLDDGAYLTAKILIKLAKLNEEGKNIEDLLEGYKEPEESKEIRLRITADSRNEYMDKLMKDIETHSKKTENWEQVKENYEGIRVNCTYKEGKGWFLLRSSLHEPIICINIESNFQNGTDLITKEVTDILKNYKEIEMSGL